MGAVGDDAVEERLALDALAHEPALHVRDGDDDRVDPAVADHLLELDETRVLGRRGRDRSSCPRSGSWSMARAGRRCRPALGVDAGWVRPRQAAPTSPAALLELALDLGQFGSRRP